MKKLQSSTKKSHSTKIEVRQLFGPGVLIPTQKYYLGFRIYIKFLILEFESHSNDL